MVLYLQRVVDFGFDAGLGVREVALHREQLRMLAPSVLTGRLALAAVLAVLLAVVAYLVLPAPENAVVAAYGLTLLTVGAGTRWIHLGLERTRVVAGARTLGEAVMATGVLLLVRRPSDIGWMPAAQFAGDAVAALLLLGMLRRGGHTFRVGVDWAAVRPLVQRAWPLMASGLLGLVIFNADLVFLRVFHDRTAVGYYAAAYALVSFLLNMGTAYSLSLLPTLSRLGPGTAAQYALYHTAAAQVFAVALPIAVGGSLLASPITDFVFGADYPESGPALTILIWSVPLLLIRSVPVVGLMARGREDQVLRVTAWSAVANTLLNFILIPPWGVLGAALATVATEAIRFSLALIAARAEGFVVTRPRRFWRTAVAGSVMAGVLLLLPASMPVWLAIAAGMVSYFVVLTAVQGIRLEPGALPRLEV